MTAFSPLGHGASYFNPSIAAINEKIVKELATKYGKVIFHNNLEIAIYWVI